MGIESPTHLIFVAIVALVVLGPKRLPDLARSLGNGIREFRQSLDLGSQDQPPQTPPPPAASTSPAPLPGDVAAPPPAAAAPSGAAAAAAPSKPRRRRAPSTAEAQTPNAAVAPPVWETASEATSGPSDADHP
jgi:sec-independent protein translocase protein TatA